MAQERPSTQTTPQPVSAVVPSCTIASAPKAAAGKWRRKRSRLTSKLGAARHEASDTIATPGQKVTLRAKFQYGRVRKDLTGETVEIWRSGCDKTYRALGTSKTSSDGWVEHKIVAPRTPGVYTLAFRVRGDNSLTMSRLWVLRKKQSVAIFDLDGTLTVSDKEIQKQAAKALLTTGRSTYSPKAYPAADAVTLAYASKRAVPIYISGRPYWFGAWTRRWLTAGGYAPGPVILTRQHRQVAPTNKGVGVFKLAQLKKLQKQGFAIEAAHGNATTDIYAYQSAKIPNSRIYIIGPHGGQKKTQRVKASWQALVDRLRGTKKPQEQKQ